MGASGDIGASISRTLAKEGWSLYLHAHTHKKIVDDMRKDFQSRYPRQDFFSLQMDMGDEEQIEKFVDNFFSLDAVVFASGYTQYGLLEETTSEEMERMWRVHVKTPVLLLQRLQSKLAQSGTGRVVFISSVYGETGSPLEVMYSTLKGAQLAFVKAYSKEVGSMGITVNAISPGAIDTKMNRFLSSEERENLTATIPLGRMGTVEEVGIWVKQLLSKDSGYVTGQSIVVSGGWMK